MAFVCEATTDRQRVLETTIGSSLEDLAKTDIKPPAIVVVGEAVRLRSALDWLGALDGKVLEPDPLGKLLDQEAG
jgi:uroporphyrin-III C-methyltransferase